LILQGRKAKTSSLIQIKMQRALPLKKILPWLHVEGRFKAVVDAVMDAWLEPTMTESMEAAGP
jgi:hypothetical protein